MRANARRRDCAMLCRWHPVPSEGRLQCSLRGAGSGGRCRSEATRRSWFRRPKPHGPDALSCASPEAIGRTRAAPSQRRRAGVPHQRWTRSREGPEKGESTGGFVEQASNIACGTSGDDEPAVTDYPDRLRAVRRERLRGFFGTRRPARPRIVSGRASSRRGARPRTQIGRCSVGYARCLKRESGSGAGFTSP